MPFETQSPEEVGQRCREPESLDRLIKRIMLFHCSITRMPIVVQHTPDSRVLLYLIGLRVQCFRERAIEGALLIHGVCSSVWIKCQRLLQSPTLSTLNIRNPDTKALSLFSNRYPDLQLHLRPTHCLQVCVCVYLPIYLPI